MATESQIQAMVIELTNTLSPDPVVRKSAENRLEDGQKTKGFAVILLSLIQDPAIPLDIRTAGAINLKNFVKRHWDPDDVSSDRICEADRNAIKGFVVRLMLDSPEKVQRQLSDVITLIGRSDFPEKWPTLLDELITCMTNANGNFRIIHGVLQTAHSLFRHYRHDFKSQKLWIEIKFVLEKFAKPLTELFVQLVAFAKVQANNRDALKTICGSLVLCAKIFNSLNTQDLPEFFEDHMSVWMQHFLELLSLDDRLLQTDTDEEMGLSEQLKAHICENITMYASKYGEEFQPFLQNFVQAVWSLLVSTGPEPKYDLLISAAIKFLTTVADRPSNRSLFEGEGVLNNLCSNVVIPNMQFRTSDEELFEDNPEEFIRRDIEGSDIDTRRRAACDLVRSLSRYFEPQITAIFGQYIQTMLQTFVSNPEKQWRNKDAAVYLVTSMAVKGSTLRTGTTNTSELVNIVDFYTGYIKPDLEGSDVNRLPVLRADALKYIVTFRNQLDVKTHLIPVLPLVIQHLTASSVVVHTYAAHAMEKMLTLRNQQDTSRTAITSQDLQSHVAPLLRGLFGALNLPGSTENEYIMKCIMRTISLMQADITPFLEEMLPQMAMKLSQVSKNPCKPHFNHFLFESLCLTARIVCDQNKAHIGMIESLLFPVFQEILTQDVLEFQPYVFQIMSLLLEYYGPDEVPQTYMALFQMFLSPSLWEKHPNVPGLVRFLTAYVARAAPQIVASGRMGPVLGVFQKLIASKSNDHEGFYLLQSLILHMDPSHMSQYNKDIFFVLFQRLVSSKTTKYIKSLLVFFCLFSYKYGAASLVQVIDSVSPTQPQMFGMVIERLFLLDLQKVSGPIDRRICAVGVCNILFDNPSIVTGPYQNFFCPLLKALVALLELPEDDATPDDEHFIDVEETAGYQASHVRLAFGSKKEEDPFGNSIPDTQIHVARCLHTFSTKHPQFCSVALKQLEGDVYKFLMKYLNVAGLTLPS